MNNPIRTIDQNAAMWPALHDLAAQVGYRPARWRGDRCIEEGGYAPMGRGIRALTPDDWKDVMTALWKTTTGARIRYVPHPDGNGLIALGLRTSRLTKREMSDLLDCIHAFGAEHGVVFSEPEAA
jgi:hypothetical protein